MRATIAWLLVGMAAVTFLPRFLPLAFLARMSLSPRLKALLSYMPVAIMAAIVFPVLFSTSEKALSFEPRLLFSALPVIILTYFLKNLWLSVVAGMLTYWLTG